MRGAVVRIRARGRHGERRRHPHVCQGNGARRVWRRYAIFHFAALQWMQAEAAVEPYFRAHFHADTRGVVGQTHKLHDGRIHAREIERGRLHAAIDARIASSAAAHAAHSAAAAIAAARAATAARRGHSAHASGARFTATR